MTRLALSQTTVSPSHTIDNEDPYVGYSYSYPHKSAYEELSPAVPLEAVWQAERRDALFLYIHVPFCEMRCGFCNLFAVAGDSAIEAYLDALERQAKALAEITAGDRRVVRMAVGGGTPTYLSARQLDRLFDIAEDRFAAIPHGVPTSFETSPKTALDDRLAVLRDRGVERVSLGVQSFRDEETHAIGRPQSIGEVETALDRLRSFPVLNIDLIYGQPGQTVESWLFSLDRALRWLPDELFLYPLYVRPGTGIGRRGGVNRSATSLMTTLYREARDRLVAEGYEQMSMRFFQKPRRFAQTRPIYCCQTDAMLGLGCGARSYTSGLHYSSRFAVASGDVHAILSEWIDQDADAFRRATWGCWLTDEDRRRRFLLQSLLTCAGLNEADFEREFGDRVLEAFPVLLEWINAGLVVRSGRNLQLTASGLERSDAIGPALYEASKRVQFERFTK